MNNHPDRKGEARQVGNYLNVDLKIMNKGNHMRTLRNYCVLVGFAFIFSACGGSGGGSDPDIILAVPDDITVAAQDAAGAPADLADIQIFLAGASATDDQGQAVDDIQHNAPAVFPLGQTVVTFTASNAEAAVDANATVTVVDMTAPTLSLLGASDITVVQGQQYTEPGVSATDNVDGDLSAEVSISGSVDVSTVGSYTLQYAVSDAAGNSAPTLERTVRVQDADAPVLTVPASITVAAIDAAGTPASQQAIQDFLLAASAVDADGAALNDITHNAPDVFPLGRTSVQFTATDGLANSSSGSAHVNVVDQTAPQLTLVGEVALQVVTGATFTDPGASAVDNVDGDISAAIVTTGVVDTSTDGTYTLSYQVSDTAGNAAAPIYRTVSVQSDSAPVVVAPASITVAAVDADGVPATDTAVLAFLVGASASDSEDGAITDIAHDAPAELPLGVTTVRFSATDSDGNSGYANATITVADMDAPILSLEGDATIELLLHEPFVDPGVTAVDNVDGSLSDSVVITGTVDTATVGTYIVVYDVSDAAGNSAVSVQRTVTVWEDVPPQDIGISVYFKKPTAWGEAYVHSWGAVPAGQTPTVEWPGLAMTDIGDGWYVHHFAFLSSVNLLFNANTAPKTADLSRTASGCYEGGVWQDLADCSVPDAPVDLRLSTTQAGFTSEYLDVKVAIFGADPSARARYTLDGSAPGDSTAQVSNGGTVRIGETAEVGEEITLRVAFGDQQLSHSYTKGDAADGLNIYAIAPASWSGVDIHYFDVMPSGTLGNTTWPGVAMEDLGGGRYHIIIPGAESASVIFSDNGSNQTGDLTRTSDGCYLIESLSWQDSCEVPLGVSASVPAGNFSSDSLAVTLRYAGAGDVSGKYTLDGSDPLLEGLDFTTGLELNIGSELAVGESITLRLTATDGVETVAASYVYTKQAPPEAGDFSWDNATVYFVLTDRFLDADSANNNSYGRESSLDNAVYDGYQTREGTFHGGDLQGLTQKITEGYFTDLGVTAIWLTSPLEQIHGFVGGENFKHYAYHGYYHLDFTQIDANMGTKADFAEFVDTAHEHGIRVVMDVIMNHAGYETIGDMDTHGFGALVDGWSDYYHTSDATSIHFDSYGDFIDIAASTESDWAQWWGGDWIRKSRDGTAYPGYDACGGNDLLMCLSGLPDFRTESSAVVELPPLLVNKWGAVQTDIEQAELDAFFSETGLSPTVSNHLIKWITDWVREYGIDGFRVDTVKHVEPAVWHQLKIQAATAYEQWKDNNPGAWADDQDLAFWMTGEVWGHGVNRSNYFDNGFDSVINFGFQGQAGNLANAENVFREYAARINSDDSFNVLSYISSHDTSLFNREGLTNAGTMLLLLPGAVQIFYGDETARPGDVGFHWDQPTRSDMNWSTINSANLAHWQKLGTFRANHIAVGGGSHRQLTASPYTFARELANDAVVVTLGATGSVSVSVAGVFADGTVLRDAYSDQQVTVSGGAVVVPNVASPGVILLERVTQ